MPIEIHPEAATRFNELGNALLQQVIPEPSCAEVQGDFRPDIYPVAQIPEKDLIGELVEIHSVVNGAGEEVGRFFQHTSPKVGVLGNGFLALNQLAQQIQRTESLRHTTTIGFIRDAIFGWAEARYAQKTTESLMECIAKHAGKEIQDFEIWIPLHRTYVESSFPLGRITVRTITSSMMDEAEARVPIPDKETAAAVKFAFARDRSVVQGCAAVAVKIYAEKQKALEVARQEVETAAAFLRFFSPANWTPKLRSYCTPLGSENLRRRAELFIDNGSIANYSRGVLDSGGYWVLSNSDFANFPGVLHRLSALSGERNRSPFQQSLFDALLIHSRNSVAIEPADKLVYILVAIESMLLRNSNEPLGKNIGERMAFLIGNSVESREAVLSNVEDVYRLRSSFIHHGHSIGDLGVLSNFMLNAWTCLAVLLENKDRFRTKDDLISALEHMKFSGGLE